MAASVWFWLCVCAVCSAAAEKLKQQQADGSPLHSGSSARTGAWNQEKPKRLFARTRYLSPQRLHGMRHKTEPVGAAPAPARRCAGLMENCSGRTPCCEPCASCHCRLFNTICHCWRLGSCPKKT